MKEIHEENGKWYFWDEVGADRYGPYDTEEEAKKELQLYFEYLDGKLQAGKEAIQSEAEKES